jgi:hypothetical protein
MFSVSAVCGVVPEVLVVRDDAKGGCTYATATDPDSPISAYQPCATLFTGQCASYDGYLTLVTVSDGSGTYIEPDFQSYLMTIGLGEIRSVYALNVYFIQVPPSGTVPLPVSVSFLPGLTRISSTVSIVECNAEDAVKGGCPNSPTAPTASRLAAVPALSRVYRVQELFVRNTAMQDMTSFIGLTCPPSVITLIGNLGLSTLTGLQNVEAWVKDAAGPPMSMYQNALTTLASVWALQTMARCDPTGGTTLSGGLSIEVAQCPNGLSVRAQCPCHCS